MAEFKQDPINAAVSQGGFSREKGGNLRDHNGCKAGPGTMATTHYDGDYGIASGAQVMAGGHPAVMEQFKGKTGMGR